MQKMREVFVSVLTRSQEKLFNLIGHNAPAMLRFGYSEALVFDGVIRCNYRTYRALIVRGLITEGLDSRLGYFENVRIKRK